MPWPLFTLLFFGGMLACSMWRNAALRCAWCDLNQRFAFGSVVLSDRRRRCSSEIERNLVRPPVVTAWREGGAVDPAVPH